MKIKKSMVPRNSKEYKELLDVRDKMLKAMAMLEKAKEQVEAIEQEKEQAPIIKVI